MVTGWSYSNVKKIIGTSVLVVAMVLHQIPGRRLLFSLWQRSHHSFSNNSFGSIQRVPKKHAPRIHAAKKCLAPKFSAFFGPRAYFLPVRSFTFYLGMVCADGVRNLVRLPHPLFFFTPAPSRAPPVSL